MKKFKNALSTSSKFHSPRKIRAQNSSQQRKAQSSVDFEPAFQETMDIHEAASAGDVDRIQELVEEHERDIVHIARNREGLSWTPLHCASQGGHLPAVQCLVEHSLAELNQGDWRRMTPLHLACDYGHVPVVQFLVHHGADIHAKDIYRKTPLHSVCFRGNLLLAQYLIQKGAEVNAQNDDGETPLHQSSSNGHLEVVQCLIQNGADLNATNQYGFTPLQEACGRGHLAVVEFLVRSGSDIGANVIPDDITRTPLSWARDMGHWDVVHYLENMIKLRQYHSLVLYLAQTGALQVKETLLSVKRNKWAWYEEGK